MCSQPKKLTYSQVVLYDAKIQPAPAKTAGADCMHFLTAEFCVFSCCEAEICGKYSPKFPSHDSHLCKKDVLPLGSKNPTGIVWSGNHHVR